MSGYLILFYGHCCLHLCLSCYPLHLVFQKLLIINNCTIKAILHAVSSLNLSCFSQVCCICWSMMRSMYSHCPVPMPAPSWLCHGWNLGERSLSTVPRVDTLPLSLFTPNPSTEEKYTGRQRQFCAKINLEVALRKPQLHLLSYVSTNTRNYSCRCKKIDYHPRETVFVLPLAFCWQESRTLCVYAITNGSHEPDYICIKPNIILLSYCNVTVFALSAFMTPMCCQNDECVS